MLSPRPNVRSTLATTLVLIATGCWLEGEALIPRSRVASLGARPPPEAAASLVPPGAPDADHAPRGPRHDLLAMTRGELWAAWNSLRGDAYPLDPIERRLERAEHLECKPDALVSHRGTLLPYRGSVRVDPAFRERLVRFEQLVLEVAREVYGRAPKRLRHFGAYACRSTRNRSHRLSEHALGNAIDVVGFDFARADDDEPLLDGLPRELRGPFEIRVARHWRARSKSQAAAVHARFLRELAARLGARRDVFRGMIGPSRSDHSDHFHLDMSPWRYFYF